MPIKSRSNQLYFIQKEVVDFAQGTLWFSSKELVRGKKLKDFLGGANEKSKVIVKLSTRFVYFHLCLVSKTCNENRAYQQNLTVEYLIPLNNEHIKVYIH
jgi:hypothetical protein